MLRNPSVVVLLMTFAVMLMVAACGPSNEDIDARIEAKVSEMLTDTQESTKNIFSASTGSSPDKQGKRADWLNDIKASEAKAKTEREAMFSELKEAAAQAQAEQAKAQQAKADRKNLMRKKLANLKAAVVLMAKIKTIQMRSLQTRLTVLLMQSTKQPSFSSTTYSMRAIPPERRSLMQIAAQQRLRNTVLT